MKRAEKTGFFHICTDGTSLPWMFQDEKDFIAGVNRIGICSVMTGVIAVAFILMDNHIHLVLYGSMPECKAFINLYKRLTGSWISSRYGIKDYLRHLPAEIIRIEDEESLLNTIAYIDRNSIVSGYRFIPQEYPWGTSRHIFREKAEESAYRRLDTLSVREQRSILNTRVKLPGHWLIDKAGMIIPSSFINIPRLEKYFGSPARYTYFLAKKLEGKIEMTMKYSRKTFIPDKELRPIVKEMCTGAFGTADIKSLDVKSRLVIAKRLRYDYASSIKQIARMTGLDENMLEDFI